MANANRPTLHEILEGYRQFNQWEEDEEQRRLPELSIEESPNQFVELCELVQPCHLEPDIRLQMLEEERSGWIKLVNRYRTNERLA